MLHVPSLQMAILSTVVAFATTAAPARAIADIGDGAISPCSCVWDNSTKIYPPHSRQAGFFSTTVKYQCGYLCQDGNGQIQQVIADHEASFSGGEAGNEVVCDGLNYKGEENPTGSFGRWVIYMWDGVTHSFDARNSKSSSLRAWGQNSCGGENASNTNVDGGATAPVVRSLSLNKFQIDQLREKAGMSTLSPKNKVAMTAKAEALSEDLQKFCRAPTALQKSFVEGKIADRIEGSCRAEFSPESSQNFENLRQQVFRIKTSDEVVRLTEKMQNILLCPLFANVSSPAIMRIVLDRMAITIQGSEEGRAALKELTCTSALRGMKSSLMSSSLKAALQFE